MLEIIPLVETGCGSSHVIAAMSDTAIDTVRRLEAAALEHPQVSIAVDHFLHAGLYSRTVLVPAGVMITVPTLLIVRGDTTVYVGDGTMRLEGYHVVRADAGRKQAFVAHGDTHLTMIFPTQAATVEEAEREFTNEVDKLQSRQEAVCQA